MGSFTLILAAVMGLLFVALPLSVVQVLMSGWFDLARLYPGQPIQTDRVSDRGTTTLRLSRHRWYRVAARYITDDDHLHLRLVSPVALLHEPISVPWAAIERATGSPGSGLVQLSIVGHPIHVAVPPRLIEREIAIRRLIAAQREAAADAGAAGRP
jgi:hypothetical protein